MESLGRHQVTSWLRHAGAVLAVVAATSAAPPTAAAAGRRVALVIGNADYAPASIEKLPDVYVAAVRMFDTLAALGFEVHEKRPLINQTKEEMLTAAAAFALKARGAEVVFVYYTGHGAEQDGSNRLIPIDARRDSGGLLRPNVNFEEEFLALFNDTNAPLVFVIDACRDAGGATGPMAKPSDKVKNRLIALPVRAGRYVTPPSRYTTALIDSLKEPGLRIEDVFSRTRRKVQSDTNLLENPEETGSLEEPPIYLQPTIIPEGTLATVDRNTYFLVTDGRWRRIPDVGSIERLGFDASFATLKAAEERVRSPQGGDYPSVDTNLLQSRTCLYYLFWGMKWCVPPEEATADLRRYEKGSRRSLTTKESLGIPTGEIRRLPTGFLLRFGEAPQLYEINSGVLSKVVAPRGNDARALVLPRFMQRRLGGEAAVNVNPLANSHLIADEARQHVYIGDEALSRVLLVDMKSGRAMAVQDVTPSAMALAPKKGHLFVADSTRHVIHQIDVAAGRRISMLPQVFPSPTYFTGIVVTPDETRLYVANQGGGTVLEAGAIVAYDLANPASTVMIGGLACPEKMSITADGEHVYIASQCGGARDPLFVLDTNLDIATELASGLAIGRAAAVVSAGRKVYVSRGEPEQVTAVDSLSGDILGSQPIDAHSMAVAPDGSMVAAIGNTDNKKLYLIDTTNERVTTVAFDYPLKAVTMGQSNGNAMVIAWLPERTTAPLYFQSLAGLVAGQR